METTEDGPDWVDRAAENVCLELEDYIPGRAQHAHAVKAIAKAIRDHAGRPPDYYIDTNPDLNSDEYNLRDAVDVAGSLCVGEISRYATYFSGPVKYAACVLREGNDGPIDTEIRWCDSEEDALKAVGAKPGEAE